MTRLLQPVPAVDEMSQNRHILATGRAVGSTVRAAGGFPTQGGGARANAAAPARSDLAPSQAAV